VAEALRFQEGIAEKIETKQERKDERQLLSAKTRKGMSKCRVLERFLEFKESGEGEAAKNNPNYLTAVPGGQKLPTEKLGT